MRKHKAFAPPALAHVVLAGLVLGGCNTGEFVKSPDTWLREAYQTGKWRQAHRAPRTEVEIVAMEHAVDFGSSAEQLSPQVRRDLLAFLQQTDPRRGDRITLHGPMRDRGRHDPVTASRLGTLQDTLNQIGIESEIIEGGRVTPRDRDRIVLLVTRAVAVVPDCSQPSPALAHRPRINFNCANNTNIGLMVVDPLDLEHGRTMDPADGEAAALGIQRYREHDIVPLDEAEISTTSEEQ